MNQLIALKKAPYRNWGYPSVGPEYGEVAYIIIGDCCYFTDAIDHGTYSHGLTTTINAAEDILTQIATEEGRPIRSLRYFDLQTHLGYQSKRPGQFELSELRLDQCNPDDEETEDGGIVLGSGFTVNVAGWQDVRAPLEVLQRFRDFIG